jgi:hypothetical protein
MDKLKKLINNLRLNENKSTINVLNDDCIQEIIKKLSINEIFGIEKVDKRFQFCVEEVLRQQTVLRFGGKMFCKHSANNSQIINSETDINFEKIKAVLKKCPNIKCLQMREILINKSLIEWISNNCKQLVCIHLYRPKSKSKSPQIEFKEIGKLLSDKIEIEIIFGNEMSEHSIRALLQNMPQIKDIDFWTNFNDISIRGLILYFGHNIRSLSIIVGNDLTINDLNAIKNNTNLVELSLYSSVNSQQKFDFICDNFTQLKTFGSYGNEFISISKLNKLINLQNLKLFIRGLDIDFSSMDKNQCLNKTLKSLKLSSIMTPKLFERLVQMFPNIEKLSLNYLKFFCEHQNHNENEKYGCLECMDKIFKYLSKLNRLKVLEIIPFSCATLIAIERNINEQDFKHLVELKLCINGNLILDNNSKQSFLNLIQSLIQFSDKNTKQFFTLKTNEDFVDLITGKKIINGVKYKVFFNCEKFEEKYGKKFEIPKNMRIIRFLKCI